MNRHEFVGSAALCAAAGLWIGGAYAATALPPLVGDGVADDTAAIQARLDAGSSCVYLPPKAMVKNLTVHDCRMTNKLAQPIKFLDVRGRVRKLVNENNTFAGAWENK